jgi:DNA polymerase II large subunit
MKDNYICIKCEEKWSFDPNDGKCPLCRGNIIPIYLYEKKSRNRPTTSPAIK